MGINKHKFLFDVECPNCKESHKVEFDINLPDNLVVDKETLDNWELDTTKIQSVAKKAASV